MLYHIVMKRCIYIYMYVYCMNVGVIAGTGRFGFGGFWPLRAISLALPNNLAEFMIYRRRSYTLFTKGKTYDFISCDFKVLLWFFDFAWILHRFYSMLLDFWQYRTILLELLQPWHGQSKRGHSLRTYCSLIAGFPGEQHGGGAIVDGF